MRRFLIVMLALVPLLGAIGMSDADARAGGGHSGGSRGSRSMAAPRPTSIAPNVAPTQRPGPGANAPMGGMGRQPRPFLTGLLGGFLGAGLIGLLFGGGLFGGNLGFGGLLGIILQVIIIVLILRWLFRLFANRGAGRGMPGGFAGQGAGGIPGFTGAPRGMAPVQTAPLQLTQADRQAFAQCFTYVQDAWSAGDLGALSRVATPEITAMFQDQARSLGQQGLRNRVRDVRIEAMELSEAWSEPSGDYATVALRFSLIDYTEDQTGRVVDGDPSVRAVVSEVWTFVRQRGGLWAVSAIQQTG